MFYIEMMPHFPHAAFVMPIGDWLNNTVQQLSPRLVIAFQKDVTLNKADDDDRRRQYDTDEEHRHAAR